MMSPVFKMSWIRNIGSVGPAPQHHLGGKKATERLLGMADIRDGSRVLVIGCGNADTALAIAMTAGCRVTATEVNPASLRHAEKSIEKNRRKLKGDVRLLLDDLLDSRLERDTFDRVVVESVLIMLPKEAALGAIYSLLAPGGILAMNEGLRISGDAASMKGIEDEFAGVGIDWSLPTHDEWRKYLEAAGFEILSESSPIPFNLTRMGVESFLRSPIGNSARFFRTLFNSEARRFFYRTFRAMRKARLRWGYCLWLGRRPF